MKPHIARAVGYMQDDLQLCNMSAHCRTRDGYVLKKRELCAQLDEVKRRGEDCEGAEEFARLQSLQERFFLRLGELEYVWETRRKSRNAFMRLLQKEATSYAEVLTGMRALVAKNEELPRASEKLVFAVAKRSLWTRQMLQSVDDVVDTTEEEFGVALYPNKFKLLKQAIAYVATAERCAYEDGDGTS